MRRIAIVLSAVGVALVATAAPAAAHVAVEPASAPKGADAVLAIVVPNEKDPQTTTKVVVQFPIDHPIAEALVEPIAGWTADVAQFTPATPIHTDTGDVTTAVKSVTWTAAAGKGIPVGHFQEFRVSVGLPDDADSLAFPTTQTYSDGSTVDWSQVTPAGGPEPDNPEPVLTLTAPSGTQTASGTPASGAVSKSDVDSARTVAIVGLAIGALGLIAGIAGIVLARRRASTAP